MLQNVGIKLEMFPRKVQIYSIHNLKMFTICSIINNSVAPKNDKPKRRVYFY